ncbi:gastric inhibitory polypeptide [Lepisosteus oculatus]|uniref:gastric inhibitory polypeptide n=1 Tax=Lepisosteus oculatus TaxID=7918 RepID=UPI0037106238
MMKVGMSFLLLCVVGMVLAQQESRLEQEPGEQRRVFGKRYAESTLASDISKIVDSMVQKNFVNFLLTRREKKSDRRGERSAGGSEALQLLSDLVRQELIESALRTASKDRTQ